MRPNELAAKFFKLKDSSGLVTGAVIGDFTVEVLHLPTGDSSASSWTHGATLTELSTGKYQLTYTTPPVRSDYALDFIPVSATQWLEWYTIYDEVEGQDRDSLYANVTARSGVLSTTGVLGNPIDIEIRVYRYQPLSIAVIDSAGDPVTFISDGYTNFKVGIRSQDQATIEWTGQPNEPWGFNVSGDDDGNLALTFPKSMRGPIATEWTASAPVTLGDFIVPTTLNGWIYQVTTAGTTDSSEPTWPTTEGDTVVDGTVTWTARKRQIWSASTAKLVGQVVRPTADATSAAPRLFRCIVAGTTDSSEPTWPADGDAAGSTVVDDGVTWALQKDVYAYLAEGSTSAELFYEVIADEGGSSDRTRPVIGSSKLTEKRREEGA